MRVSKSKTCLNVKSSTYYFYALTKALVDFQIYINVPLMERHDFRATKS